jgi:hypothetical protein
MAGSDSPKERFILRRKRAAAVEASELGPVLDATAGVKVLDVSPRMVLVDAHLPTLQEVMRQHPDWEIARETQLDLPDTRLKNKRP